MKEQYQLTGEQIAHILEAQESMCKLVENEGDDGSCSICQAIKKALANPVQPPGDEELREELAKKLYRQRWHDGIPTWENSRLQDLFRNYADQIMSLLSARIAKARAEERDRITNLLLDKDWGTMCEDTDKACPSCKYLWKAIESGG